VCLATPQRTASFSRQEFSFTSFKTLNENGRKAAAVSRIQTENYNPRGSNSV